MNRLISETNDMLQKASFDWSICGGWAIDMFCGRQTRKHCDIDISAFWEDRDAVTRFMKDLDWTVYDACGGGIVHLATDYPQEKYGNKNIFCVKEGNRFVHVTPIGDELFKFDFKQTDQVELDYVEFLFNKRDSGCFLYARNEEIKRDLANAVLDYHGIPHLAPEIVLLYKSTENTRDDYERDFTAATVKMSDNQRDWLVNSLDLCYPDGHPWSNRLKDLPKG